MGNVTPGRNLGLHLDSTNFLCKGPDILDFVGQSLSQLLISAIVAQKQHRQYINKGYGCVPVKLDLQKLEAGQLWIVG